MRLQQIAPNFTAVWLPGVRVLFSYETPIAFQVVNKPIVARVNDWSAATGKHLNKCQPDRSKRLEASEFLDALRKATA